MNGNTNTNTNMNTSSGSRNNFRSFVSGHNSHTKTTSHVALETVMSPMAAAAAAAVANSNNSSYYTNTQQSSNHNLSGIGMEIEAGRGVVETKAGGMHHTNRRRAKSFMDLSRLTSSLDSNDGMEYSGEGEEEGDVEMGMVVVVQPVDDSIDDDGDSDGVHFDDSPPRIHSHQPFEQMNPILLTPIALSRSLDDVDDTVI